MRIGVIGVGRMGVVHARTLVAHPEVTAVVVQDVDRSRADEVAAELGVEVSDDAGAVMGTVDGVVVAAASSVHAELLHAAADRGLTTFCEKPISIDLKSTAEVVAHVRDAGVQVQMGFQRRFDAGYVGAHDLVESGALGTLYVVRMAGHDPRPPHEAYIPASGGIFRDFGIHDFDALRFVTGQEVVEVFAEGAVIAFPIFAKYDDVDTAAAVLRLSSGALALLSTTRHDPLGYDIRMELLGSGDSVAVGWDERMPLRSIEPGGPSAPEDPYPDFQRRFAPAYAAEMHAFVDMVAGRRPSLCTVQDAYEALRIAEACDRSRREHRPVALEEVG
jgi:myo-inositol 2-dehydrogenase / D-chiro-inositol 1-dehydrogenase